jgi:hypothetical protein
LFSERQMIPSLKCIRYYGKITPTSKQVGEPLIIFVDRQHEDGQCRPLRWGTPHLKFIVEMFNTSK